MKQNKLRTANKITKESKRLARELLDTGNNRLWLSLSVVLCIVTAGAIYLLGAGLAYAADSSVLTDQPSQLAATLAVISYALMLLLAIVLLVPMTGGVMLLARYVYERKSIEVSDLFVAFDSAKQYFRCMGLGLYGLMRPVLTVAAALLGCVAFPSLLAEMMRDAGAISVLIWLACAGAFLAGAALTVTVLAVCRTACFKGALLARGASWRQAGLRAREIAAQNRVFPFRYRLGFVGHVLLGVLTVGVSAVTDGIGHALLSHQFSCDAYKTQGK